MGIGKEKIKMFFDNSLKSIVNSINDTLGSDYTTREILDNTTFQITMYAYTFNVYTCTCVLEGVTFTFIGTWYKDNNAISYNNLIVKDNAKVKCYC